VWAVDCRQARAAATQRETAGGVDVGTEQVLQPCIAVEAGPVLAHLHDPGRHDRRRRVDGDYPRHLCRRCGLANGQRNLLFRSSCAPAQQPWVERAQVDAKQDSHKRVAPRVSGATNQAHGQSVRQSWPHLLGDQPPPAPDSQ
jgi:hypothetical protein